MQLTREQIERFDRDGYLVIPDLVATGPTRVEVLEPRLRSFAGSRLP